MDGVETLISARVLHCGRVRHEDLCWHDRAQIYDYGRQETSARFYPISRRDWGRGDVALGGRGAAGPPEHWFLFDRGAAGRIKLVSTTDVTRQSWHLPSPGGGMRPLGEMPESLARRATLLQGAAQPFLTLVNAADDRGKLLI